MTDQPLYVSRDGLEKLKQELKWLKSTKRQEVAARIEKAKDLGDLSENAEYAEAKDEFAFTEGRILELEDAVLRAEVIEAKTDNGQVGLGCTVRVAVGGREREFTVVGAAEAAPLEGRVSNESPLGRALLGKKVGDSVQVAAPSGPVTYEIKEIKC